MTSANFSTWSSTTTRWTPWAACWPRHLGRVPIVGSEVEVSGHPAARRAAGGPAEPRQPHHCGRRGPQAETDLERPSRTEADQRQQGVDIVTKHERSPDAGRCAGGFRAGFAVLVGRPNAGKSTLTNALVGQKVAITSAKPQTTRHTIRGIVHRDDVPADPGRHPRAAPSAHPAGQAAERPRGGHPVRGRRDRLLPARQREDRPRGQVHRRPAGRRRPQARSSPSSPRPTWWTAQALTEQLLAVAALGREVLGEDGWADVVPVSAADGFQVETVADVLVGHMPPSPPLYPDGELTDEPEAVMVAELVREAALEGVRDELPHSLAVVVEEIVPREGRPEDNQLLDVRVNLYVERPSQKAIIIGKGGCPAARGGHQRPARHRGAAGHPDLPGPARQGGQGLAARPEAAGQTGLLSRPGRPPAASVATASFRQLQAYSQPGHRKLGLSSL